MSAFLQNLIYGVQLGSLYALIALGYTMVYGVLRLINFAHGEVYMVGAFMGFYACTRWLPFQDLTKHPEAATSNIGLAFVALLIAMAVCALLGVVIERFAYRPLRNGLNKGDAHFWGFALALPFAIRFGGPLASAKGFLFLLIFGIAFGFAFRPVMAWLAGRIKLSSSRINALITAIGVSLLLQNGGILVFGAENNFIPDILPEKQITLPGDIRLSSSLLATLILSLALMGVLRYIVLYTRRGKAMRAISHDIEAAKLMGIDTDRIISFTFALGGALAGAAGAMIAAQTHLKITPQFGVQPGLKAFVAAVLGGAGNIPGAVTGSLFMGVAEYFVAAKYSTWKDAIAFVILLLVLLIRPAGLFGKSVPEKV
jgi:branched-chain amino acid transport system permease protein